MLHTILKRSAFAPSKPASLPLINTTQSRALATIQEGSTARRVPNPRIRATPVSHDRATFTIRVRQERRSS